MLTELQLENFKCFGPGVVIPCSRLTLLTGINAKGKSTTLQSLLLLHQSIERAFAGSRLLERVDLNGRYARLGTFREIQNRDRPKGDPVQIGLEFSDEGSSTTATRLWLTQKRDEARWASIDRVDVERFSGNTSVFHKDESGGVTLDFRAEHTPHAGGGETVVAAPSAGRDDLAIASGLDRLGRVHYVSADRLGPQDFFPWSSETGFFSSVGVRGERTAEVLYLAGDERQLVRDVRQREAETLVVTDQTNAWLTYIFGAGKVRVKTISTLLTLEMNADNSAHYHRPVNLGFGYSYVLPIIVSGLVAQPGEILVVENPEAHLHPLAQSHLGEFLAKVSIAGVQVFVESHSEHILNAFRLAVKEDIQFSADSLSVLYFRRDPLEPIVRVTVEEDGRVPEWPEGFFDQRTQEFFRLFGKP